VKVSGGRTADPAVAGTHYAPHTGDVQLDAILAADGLFVNAAYYAARARTSWHVHENGQLIMVTSGTGVVTTRGGEVAIVRAGDVVHTPPGEEHWHGAAPDCFVTYTSISLGETTTHGAVTDDQYERCWETRRLRGSS
jgi:quercetin dioxygenase-like cupin family protein